MTASDPVAPWLTTHVLDTTRGVPAAGMSLTLARVAGGESSIIGSFVTNADGRTDGPLWQGSDLLPGQYEITYGVGDYFADGTTPSDRYLDVVPVRFGVSPSDVHIHVALLVTPWSYTTYRGS